MTPEAWPSAPTQLRMGSLTIACGSWAGLKKYLGPGSGAFPAECRPRAPLHLGKDPVLPVIFTFNVEDPSARADSQWVRFADPETHLQHH